MSVSEQVDAFVELMRGEIEREVDEQIASHPAADQRDLRRVRSVMIAMAIEATRVANLRVRLAELEGAMRPSGEPVH